MMSESLITMTDKINSFTIVLEKDIREDDVKDIQTALSMIKGVLAVEPNVATVGDLISEQRAKRELTMKVLKALKGEY